MALPLGRLNGLPFRPMAGAPGQGGHGPEGPTGPDQGPGQTGPGESGGDISGITHPDRWLGSGSDWRKTWSDWGFGGPSNSSLRNRMNEMDANEQANRARFGAKQGALMGAARHGRLTFTERPTDLPTPGQDPNNVTSTYGAHVTDVTGFGAPRTFGPGSHQEARLKTAEVGAERRQLRRLNRGGM